jgi:hypothetical protein
MYPAALMRPQRIATNAMINNKSSTMKFAAVMTGLGLDIVIAKPKRMLLASMVRIIVLRVMDTRFNL